LSDHPIPLRDALIASLDQQPQYLMAQQDIEKARAGVIKSYSAFLPSLAGTYENDHFVPTRPGVAIVGNTVVGGQAETYTSYGALSVNWNLFNGGRDRAAYRGSQASQRASEASLESKLDDTLEAVVVAYGDLYKAEAAARELNNQAASWRAIHSEAIARFKQGHGTTLAIGRAHSELLDAERHLYQACHALRDKSDALIKAIGLPSAPSAILRTTSPPPGTALDAADSAQFAAIVQADPSVVAALEQVAAGHARIDQARGAFLPSVSLFGKKEFLGQSASGFGPANGSLGYNSYRVGVVLQQPLGPFTTEYAQLAEARADAARLEAAYQQALLDASTKLSASLSAYFEAKDAARSAADSQRESEKLLELTESLYKAGRVAIDSVEQAHIDLAKARRSAIEFATDLSVAAWRFTRSVRPTEFPRRLLDTLNQ
jgi:outer membrane protein TolC